MEDILNSSSSLEASSSLASKRGLEKFVKLSQMSISHSLSILEKSSGSLGVGKSCVKVLPMYMPADAPDKRQHQNTTHSSTTTVVAAEPPLNIHKTPQTTNEAPTQVPNVTAPENIIQA
ncbi:hypothetical protein Tco_0566738 [Tanacetum coccineum]